MKDTRIKLDSYYYTLEAIKRSAKFKGLKERLLNRYSLPEVGFNTVADYEAWKDKILKEDILTTDIIKEVLTAFNLDIDDEKLQLGLKWILFFNKPPITTSPINFLPETNNGGNITITLNILPWATKEDLEQLELWKTVEYMRKVAKTAKTKNRGWGNFNRDIELLTLFQTVEKDIKNKTIPEYIKKQNIDTKSPYYLMPYYVQFNRIKSKYKKPDTLNNLDDELGPIISRCKRNFGSIHLL